MYIIRADYKSGAVFYVDTYYQDGNTINIFSFTNDEAMAISNKELVEFLLEEIKDSNFKTYESCPICKKELNKFPAISRRDNLTPICSECGMKEAICTFLINEKT